MAALLSQCAPAAGQAPPATLAPRAILVDFAVVDVLAQPELADHPAAICRLRFQKPIRSESRARLVEGIAKGRYWLNQLTSGDVSGTSGIAHGEDCSDRSVRITLSLAFISPRLAKAAIEGSLPAGLGVAALMGLPDDWERQRGMISNLGPSRLGSYLL